MAASTGSKLELFDGAALGAGVALDGALTVGVALAVFVGGYIITAIIALIYNWLAPRIGGIKLELE